MWHPALRFDVLATFVAASGRESSAAYVAHAIDWDTKEQVAGLNFRAGHAGEPTFTDPFTGTFWGHRGVTVRPAAEGRAPEDGIDSCDWTRLCARDAVFEELVRAFRKPSPIPPE